MVGQVPWRAGSPSGEEGGGRGRSRRGGRWRAGAAGGSVAVGPGADGRLRPAIAIDRPAAHGQRCGQRPAPVGRAGGEIGRCGSGGWWRARLAMGLGWSGAGPSYAGGCEDAATPAEVVAEVRAAAALWPSRARRAWRRSRTATARSCSRTATCSPRIAAAGIILAHPIQPERNGQPIAAGPAYGGVSAADRAKAQCAVGTSPGGGWWAYPFPKPGTAEPSRKVSYLVPVPGTSWIVGAGVYDETDTIEALTQNLRRGTLRGRRAAKGPLPILPRITTGQGQDANCC